MTLRVIAPVTALMIAVAGIGGGAFAANTAPATAKSTMPAKMTGVPLSDVANPKATLANAMIQDMDGAPVGVVNNVLLDGMGKPVELTIDVGMYLGMGTKTVAVKATNFKFDKEHMILVTSLTKNQIHVFAGG